MIVSFTLVGQSTVLIDLEGSVIMTDPWWNSFEFLRKVPLKVNPETIEPLHYMLVSHNHVDHWCNDAIDLAKRKDIAVIGSMKAVRRAERKGLRNCTSLRAGECFSCDKFSVTAVPADHPLASDAVGFIIQKDNTSLYFSGDTRYSRPVRDALNKYRLNAALVQVACSTYPIIGKDGMDMDSAMEFMEEIKPDIFIPIHYQIKGKYIPDESLMNCDTPVKVVVLRQGEKTGIQL